MNEYCGVIEQSEQCGASEWVSDTSKRANGRASGLVLTSRFLAVLNLGTPLEAELDRLAPGQKPLYNQ